MTARSLVRTELRPETMVQKMSMKKKEKGKREARLEILGL